MLQTSFLWQWLKLNWYVSVKKSKRPFLLLPCSLKYFASAVQSERSLQESREVRRGLGQAGWRGRAWRCRESAVPAGQRGAGHGAAPSVLAARGCCNMKLGKGQRPRSAVGFLPICAISWNNSDFQDSFTFFPLGPRHPFPPQAFSGTHPSAPLSFLPWAFPVVITKTSMSFIVLCPQRLSLALEIKSPLRRMEI